MKNSYFLLLYCGFSTLTVLGAGTLQAPAEATTWEDLKCATSTSVTSVAENCQKFITEARSNCKVSLDRIAEVIHHSQQCTSIRSYIQKTVADTAKLLQTVSKTMQDQLTQLSDRFEKRLKILISGSAQTQPSIAQELNNMADSLVNGNEELTLSMEQYFTVRYNPAPKFQQRLQKTIQTESNVPEELKITAKKELFELFSMFDNELTNMEKITIGVLYRVTNGLDAIKELQYALRKGTFFQKKWSDDRIKQNLLAGMQTIKSCQTISQKEDIITEEQQLDGRGTLRALHSTEEDSSEETQDEAERQDVGCTKIFARAKKNLLEQLTGTLKHIKTTQDIKKIDERTRRILKDYSSIFNNLSERVNNKIIDFIHKFSKLYKVILSIMETINRGMKEKMEKIFQDENVIYTSSFHDNIKKYLAETYPSEAKINELHATIEKSIQGGKSKQDIQQRIAKQLVVLTDNLQKDLDTMKTTTTYILVEMRKGVNALKNLQNKSNNTGWRYFFNSYTGEDDLNQLRKLINIMNILDISKLIDRKIQEVMSPEHLTKCDTVSNQTLQEIFSESKKVESQIEAQTDANKVKAVAFSCVDNYNTIVKNFSKHTKKILKRILVKFITIYEEVVIILKRKRVENTDKLEELMERAISSANSQGTLINKYLSEDEVDVRQECNLRLGSDTKKAKQAAKSQIQKLATTVSTQLNEVKSYVKEIVSMIIEEAKNLLSLKAKVAQSDKYCIQVEKFKNIEKIMQTAKLLDINSGDSAEDVAKTENSSSSDDDHELQSLFESAIQRLQTEKSVAEDEIQKCTELSQMQSSTQNTVTNISEIISSTSMEMRTIFTRFMTQFTDTLKGYIQSSDNHQFMSQIESQSCQNISVSEQLQIYVQDKYSMSALRSYIQSLQNSKSIEEARMTVTNSLNTVCQEIETEMQSVKSEAVKILSDVLKRGIKTLEEIKMNQASTVEQEKIEIISSTYHLVKQLQECMHVDTYSLMTETEKVIMKARRIIKRQYENTKTVVSSTNDDRRIEYQMENTLNQFNSAYNSMRYSVKSNIEQCSSSLLTSFKTVVNDEAENSQVKTVLQEIMCGSNNKCSQEEQFRKISSFINSEGYTSSSAVKTLYETIQRNSNNQAVQQRSLQELNSLNTQVNQNINYIEEMTKFVSNYYQKATNIIQSIKEGKIQQLTDEQIKYLATSITMSQIVIRVSNIIDFTNAQRSINQEYQRTVKTLESTSNESTVQQTMTESIVKYDSIYNNLRIEVMEKFLKSSSEFTNTYTSVLETMETQENNKLSTILQEIMEKKINAQVTEDYQKFESFISSSSFTSTTLMHDSYTQLPQTNSVRNINTGSNEQLKILTSEVNQHIIELDTVSKFVSQSFHEGMEILQSIQSSSVELTQEQINVFATCMKISDKIAQCNSALIQSLEEGKDETAFTNAQLAIKEEYENVVGKIQSGSDMEAVQQTISKSIEGYDRIYNNLRNEIKQSLLKNTQEFTNKFTAVINKSIIQNIIRDTLLNIQNNAGSKISEDCKKILCYMNSLSFTSSCLVKSSYIHSLQQSSCTETSDEQIKVLKTLTSEVNQHIAELDTKRKLIKQSIEKSMEILRSIENNVNIQQLTQEQISVLSDSFMISKRVLVQCNMNSQEMNEAFNNAETSISREYESAVKLIKSATAAENVKETMETSIDQYDSIHNSLRETVKHTLVQYSTNFTDTYNTVKETITQQNSETKTILQNIWDKKVNLQVSQEYQEFQAYIKSEAFTSSSLMFNLYANIKREDTTSTTNINERSLVHLQKSTAEVNKHITELNNMQKFVNQRFQTSLKILMSIEKNPSIQLTQEQIGTLLETTLISESITYQCSSTASEESEAFSMAKRSINEEYGKALDAIQSAMSEETATQTMKTTAEMYESTYNSLKEEVKQEFTQYSSQLMDTYQAAMEMAKSQQITQILTVLQNISDKKMHVQVSEDYKKFDTYMSKKFISPFMITNAYRNLTQQAISSTASFNEKEIQCLNSLTEEVNHHITEMNEIRMFVNTKLQKGIDIINSIENNNDIQLTQEQVTILNESVMISETIKYQCSSTSLQEQKSFSTAEKNINYEYENALNSIKTAQDETSADEVMSHTVSQYDSVYNTLKEEIIQTFTSTSSEFSNAYQTVIEIVEGQNNSKIKGILEDIKNKNVNVEISEECKEFESFIKSESFTSSSNMMNSYRNLAKQNSSFDTNLQERNSKNLKTLTNEVHEYITNMNTVSHSVNIKLQQATDILKHIESSAYHQQLTQQQITLLTESVIISETISYEFNSVSQQEEKFFTTAEQSINEEYENAASVIRSADDEASVEGAMANTVNKYDTIYSTLKEDVTKAFKQNTMQFTQIYQSVAGNVNCEHNNKVQSVLQDITQKKINIPISENYKKIESYLKSDSFKSSSISEKLHQNLQQQSNSATTSINEKNIQNLKIITNEVSKYITEMNVIHRSVNIQLQKGIDILKSVESNNIKELTKDQITSLTESILISEAVMHQRDSNHQQSGNSFSTAKKSITEEYEKAIDIMKTAKDEETIKRVLATSIEKYDSICTNLQEETKQIFIQNSSNFTETLHSAEQEFISQQNTYMQAVLRDIKDKKTHVQFSHEYKKFESYMKNDNFNSSNKVRSMYNDIQKQNSSISTTANTNEKSMEQLETLTTNVNQQIQEMSEVREYVSQRLQQSTEVLKTIEKTENIQLNQNQITTLSEGFYISEQISNQCNVNSARSVDMQEQIVSTASYKMHQEHDNTINVIKMATDKATIQEAIAVSVDRCTNTYSDLQNNIKGQINHQRESYANKFKSTIDSVKQSNTQLETTLKHIESQENIQYLQEDREYQKFSAYLKSDSFIDTNCIHNTYQHLQETQNSCTTTDISNFKEHSIQQMTSLIQNVDEKVKEISFIEKYARENYQKSTTILEKISVNRYTQLTEEEIKTLTITNEISKQLKTEISTDQQINFNEARNTIHNECQNTINSIKSMTTEEEINKAVHQNIQNYNTIYNNLQENIKTTISQNSATFAESFKSFTETDQVKNNTKMQKILQNIQDGRSTHRTNEEICKFSSYINSEDFTSTSTVNNMYQVIHRKTNQSQNINERNIQELQELINEMDKKMAEVEKSTTYALDTIKKGTQILQSIQQNKVTELNDEEITILVNCVEITKTVTRTINTNNVCVKTEQDVNIEEVENKINEERDITIEKIKSMTDENSIKQAVSNEVEYYNTMYNEVREKIETKMKDSSSNYTKSYETVINNINDHDVKETLQIITENNQNYHYDERIKKLEAYITSNEFQSTSTVKNMYESIKHIDSNTSKISTVNERAVEEVMKLSSHVTQNVNQMNEIYQYASKSLQSGSQILQTVQKREKVQLTEEEKLTLAQSCKIAQILSQMNNTETYHQSKSLDKEETTESTNIQEENTDLVRTQEQVNKELDTTIESIKSATDEITAQQIVRDNIQKYDTVYSKAQQSAQKKMDQESSTYIDSLKSAVNEVEGNSSVKNILKDIVEGKHQISQTDTKFQKILSYIKSDSFKSSHVKGMYETAQKQTSSINGKEKSIKEVQYVKETINQEIQNMDETDKYVTENLRKSKEILHVIQQGNNIQLDQKQIEQLNQSFHIAQTIKQSCQNHQNSNKNEVSTTNNNSSSAFQEKLDCIQEESNTVHQTENSNEISQQTATEKVDFENARNTITEETTNSINSIKSLNNENDIQQVVDRNVQKYDTVYKEIQQQTQNKVTQETKTFVQNFESIKKTLQENSEAQKALDQIVNGEIQYPIKQDTQFQKFVSFIGSEKYTSSTTIIDTYKKIKENTSSNDVKEQGVQEIQTISQEANADIGAMHETYTYISNNLQESAQILQQCQEKPDTQLNNQQLEQLVRSMEIVRVLRQSNQNGTRSLGKFNNTSGEVQQCEESTQKKILADHVPCDEVSKQGSVTNGTEQICESSKEKMEVNKTDELTHQKPTSQESTELETQTIYNYDVHKKKTTIFVEEDEQNSSEVTMNHGQCQSISLQALRATKTLGQISVKDLMVDWEVKFTNNQRPCDCFNLSWTNSKFNSQKISSTISEISELLLIARNVVNNTIQLQHDTMKISSEIEDVLYLTTACAQNIDNILSQTSRVIKMEMQKLLNKLNPNLKPDELESQLQSPPSEQDQQFTNAQKIFYTLHLAEKTDLLDLIDQEFSNLLCDTYEMSKEVTIKKLDRFKLVLNLIFNNIDCILLKSIDNIVNEKSVQNMNVNGQY